MFLHLKLLCTEIVHQDSGQHSVKFKGCLPCGTKYVELLKKFCEDILMK